MRRFAVPSVLGIVASLIVLAPIPATALTIVTAFAPSIVNAPDASDIENAITTSANAISSLFSNPGTVSIYFEYAPGSFLGSSDSSYYYDSYSTIVSELTANATANPQDSVLASALANLANGNDSSGAKDILATSAFFREGLNDQTATPCFNSTGTFVSSCNQTYDGVVTLSSSQPLDFTRPVPAYNGSNQTYDAVRVIEHEIDEVLGGGGSGSTLGSSDSRRYYGILDLFRYSAPGVPSFTTLSSATSYFSFDGCKSSIAGFNQNSGGDYSDWSAASPSCPGRVQDAFSCNNAQADVTASSPEFQMLEAIGYDPIAASNVVWNCSINPDSASHSGAISATKSGNCVQVVTGSNTYSGGTTISAGTLQLGAGGTSGSIVGNVTDNGTLVFNRSDSITFGGSITGTGQVYQSGSGTTTLTGTNSYSGTTYVVGGSLQAGAVNAFSPNSAVVVTSGATLDLNGYNNAVGSLQSNGAVTLGSGTLTIGANNSSSYFQGTISGTGGLVKTGSGQLVLSAANSYSGGTTISAGTLQLGAGGTSGSIVGNVTDNGTLVFNRSDSITFGGSITGTGQVYQSGSGTTTLTGTNSYSGTTYVVGGSLQAGAVNAFSPNSAVVVTSGATLDLNGYNNAVGSLQSNGAVTLGSGTLTIGANNSSSYFQGTISGTGGLVKTGSGELVLYAANSYSGGTTISAGTLQLGAGGTSGSIVGNVTDNGTLVFNRSDSITFGGSITGTGQVYQWGSGTTTLTGTNSYSGTTYVVGGSLQAGAVNAFSPNSAVVVTSGATLDLNGYNNAVGSLQSNGAVTLGSGTLTIGANNSSSYFQGTISGTGGLVKTGSGQLVLSAANSYSGGTTISAGTLQLGAGGTSGSIVGNVTDNGTLVFDRSDSITFGGSITGTGQVYQWGSGTTTLTGTNSYSGTTYVVGGSLQAGAVNAFSPNSAVVVTSGATLDLNGYNNAVGSLQSNGAVTLGSGTLTIG